ncbi:ubiquitin carboxyl-terminal hydrolase 19-like [Watersipora subatra]|uniref:ubiquitin carboxyl-terminal hydrolase 19-like n=1 Tax=Watersipora subatra TaxID=2589382 RepID=UPI00355BD3FA
MEESMKERDQGFVGLVNDRNTCFMNVIIQILANTPALKDFFLGPDLERSINRENTQGSGGKIAIEFARTVRALWSGKSELFQPCRLKVLVSEKATQFDGFAHHDAQEFFSYLLDMLHEDLNRVRKKLPYQESNGYLTDEEAAEASLRRSKWIDDSVIADQFRIQMRSELVCLTCGKASVTFDDPTKFISVSIPPPKTHISLTFFPKRTEASQRLPVKMTLEVSTDYGLTHIKQELSSRTGVKPVNLEFITVHDGEFDHVYSYAHKNTKDLYAFEVETTSSAGYSVTQIFCKQRILPSMAECAQKCAHCKKPKGEVKSLRKCSHCQTIEYCSRECQKADWPEHKKACSKPSLKAVGQPFIVSLRTSEITYEALYSTLESYASLSTDIRQPPESREEAGDADINSKNNRLFHIKPLDRRGCALPGVKGNRLMDTGDAPLKVTCEYLSVDWKNTREYEVKTREKLMCEEDKIMKEKQEAAVVRDIESCLTLFTQKETLSSDNMWLCPKCEVERVASKQVTLWSLPETLIIHLKRFSFHNNYCRDKIEDFVSYPISGLNMRRFCTGPMSKNEQLYDLYGVVNHFGSLNVGHYTAYARCPDKEDTTKHYAGWRLMDDVSVTPMKDLSEVVCGSAYILFYHRRRTTIGMTAPMPNTTISQSPVEHADSFKEFSSESDNHGLVSAPGSLFSDVPRASADSHTSAEIPSLSMSNTEQDHCIGFQMSQHSHSDQGYDSYHSSGNNLNAYISGSHKTPQKGDDNMRNGVEMSDHDRYIGNDKDSEGTDMYEIDP